MIEWTLRKRIQVGLLSLLVQWQAVKGALHPADPYLDPDYVSPAVRRAGVLPDRRLA